MKRLQCNFTTPEQSKRLLELGVPARTADGFRWDFSYAFGISEDKRYSTSINVICYEYQRDFHDKLPCWSVGRLMEIYEICTQRKFNRRNQTDDLVYLSPLEDVMMQIEHNACGFYDNTKWEINLLNK